MSAVRGAGFIHRLFNRLDGAALIQFILLVLALTSIGDGLEELVTGIASNPAFLFALLGTFTGWQLARSRWGAWRSVGIIVLCGAAVLLLTIGKLAAPLWSLFSALFALLFTSRLQVPPEQFVDTSRIVSAWSGLGDTLGGLLAHLASWFRLVEGKSVAADPLVIGLLWGFALWLLACWAAWKVRRRSAALPALLPGIALLAWASFYTNSLQSLPALLLVGAELVALQVIQNYDSSRRRWQAAGLDRIELEPGLVASVLGLSMVLVIVGALTPSISVKSLVASLDRVFEHRDDPIIRSLGLQSTPDAPLEDAAPAIHSISRTHTVSAGQELSSQVVMTVAVDGYKPPPEEAAQTGEIPEPLIRFYWRSQTFDYYTGSGWLVSSDATTFFQAGQVIRPSGETLPEGFQLVTQHVSRQLPGESILVTGELLKLDQPATVTWHSPGDFSGASTLSNVYTAESLFPLVTVETLREAGLDYPQQIRQFYLQLPDDLPQQVRSLALKITTAQSNPYDQASAIETYLRQFPYTLDVPAPPAGRDAADYFLFDLQRGYCDYAATTMVVLARAAGIPARLVVGYSRGTYAETDGTFIVRANNEHAWVEVYFPGIGWIEFEPTGSQPGITRLHDPNAPVETGQPPAVPAPPEQPVFLHLWRSLEFHSGWLVVAGIVLLLFMLIPLEGWLLLLQKPARALVIIQHRLYRLGHHWNLPRAGALTPYEFSAALAARLDPFAGTQRLAVIIPAIRRDLDWLTALYVRSLYAGWSPSRLERRRAVQAWLRLKFRLSFLRLRFWRLFSLFQINGQKPDRDWRE